MKSSRKKSALARLEKQLKDGVKPFQNRWLHTVPADEAIPKTIPLTDHDTKRIKKEIATLKGVQ